MIEQSVSLASNGVVKVPGYEQLVRFGYTKNRNVTALRKSVTAGSVSWNAVCVSWKMATTAIPTIRRRRTVISTPTLSPAILT